MKRSLFSRQGFYLVLDRKFWNAKCRKKIRAAVDKGAISVVQYRGKEISEKLFFKECSEVYDFLSGKVPLIVNDRIAVCLLLNAAGVHLGQSDLPVEQARKLLGKRKWIGLSTHNARQVKDASFQPVDYIGLGPVRATVTKQTGYSPLGLERTVKLASQTDLPVVPIGGVGARDIPFFQKAGVPQVAICRAFFEMSLSTFLRSAGLDKKA